MKQIITGLILFITLFSFSQETNEAQLLAAKKANNFVYEGNKLANEEDFVTAEMSYREAMSEQSEMVAGAYNLANTYIKSGNFEEALYRLAQAAKVATSKEDKYKAYHNMGNILMQNEKCKEAVEAYKNALRNNPSDDETRYNYAVAKACAEEQQQQDDENKDKNDENKDDNGDEDKEDKEGDKEDENKDKGDEDEKDGDDKEDDEGKPEDDKKDEGQDKKDEKEQPQPQPQPGQLSPQQIKSLLEAMNNQEQDVQDKINAEKQKGEKIQTDKDW